MVSREEEKGCSVVFMKPSSSQIYGFVCCGYHCPVPSLSVDILQVWRMRPKVGQVCSAGFCADVGGQEGCCLSLVFVFYIVVLFSFLCYEQRLSSGSVVIYWGRVLVFIKYISKRSRSLRVLFFMGRAGESKFISVMWIEFHISEYTLDS